MLPKCIQNFLMERALSVQFNYFPPYEFRHRARDVHLLHDFLVRGFKLFADPAALLQAMEDECESQGTSPPYDFSIFQDQLIAYYSSQGKTVPLIVQKYIKS